MKQGETKNGEPSAPEFPTKPTTTTTTINLLATFDQLNKMAVNNSPPLSPVRPVLRNKTDEPQATYGTPPRPPQSSLFGSDRNRLNHDSTAPDKLGSLSGFSKKGQSPPTTASGYDPYASSDSSVASSIDDGSTIGDTSAINSAPTNDKRNNTSSTNLDPSTFANQSKGPSIPALNGSKTTYGAAEIPVLNNQKTNTSSTNNLDSSTRTKQSKGPSISAAEIIALNKQKKNNSNPFANQNKGPGISVINGSKITYDAAGIVELNKQFNNSSGTNLDPNFLTKQIKGPSISAQNKNTISPDNTGILALSKQKLKTAPQPFISNGVNFPYTNMGIGNDGASIVSTRSYDDDSTINSCPILDNNDDNSTVMTDDSSVQTTNNGYVIPGMATRVNPSNIDDDSSLDDDASTRTPIHNLMPANLMNTGGTPSAYLRDRTHDNCIMSLNSNGSSSGATDSFSEDELQAARKREEENEGRLVIKAKQQHTLSTAWFAEVESPALPETQAFRSKRNNSKRPPLHQGGPKQEIKIGKNAKSLVNASPVGTPGNASSDHKHVGMSLAIPKSTGPIDLDTGDCWVDDDKTHAISIPGSFLMTTHTMATGKIKNDKFINFGVPEEEDLTHHTQRKFLNRTACTIGQTRWSLLALLVLTIGFVLTVGGAIAASLIFEGGGTAEPSARPSASPTVEVTVGKPSLAPTISAYPSLRPTSSPSGMPSDSPSSQPTSVPSQAPSGRPSTTPSASPTSTPSAQPSLSSMPSLSAMPSRPYENTIFDQIGQEQQLTHNSVKDIFGYSVSLSQDGKILAAAALNYPDTFGSVTVYKLIENENLGRSSSRWKPLGQRIDGTIAGNNFGFSIQLSADGLTLVVGEPVFESNTGRVQVFSYDVSGSWIQLGDDLTADLDDSNFGQSVTISGDGKRVAIGAPDYDALKYGLVFVHVYDDTEGSWGDGQRIKGQNGVFHGFGFDVSLSGDGSTLACSAPEAFFGYGFVMVYKLEANGVTYGDEVDVFVDEYYLNKQYYRDAGSRFGWSISLSWDGSRIAVGSPDYSSDDHVKTGRVDVYESLNDGADWSNVGEPIFGTPDSEQQLGWSVSLSYNGNHVAAGAYRRDSLNDRYFLAGQVVIHRFTNGSWGDGIEIEGQRDSEQFGFDVDLGGDANVLAVGGPAIILKGVVRAYEWIG